MMKITKIMKVQVLRETVNTLKAMVGQRIATGMTEITKMKKAVNPFSLKASVRVKGRAMKNTAKKSAKARQLRMSREKNPDAGAH